MLEDATPPMMPLDAPSPDFTDDQAILSAAREKLELDSTSVVTQALKILDAVSNSGAHGLCSQELAVSSIPSSSRLCDLNTDCECSRQCQASRYHCCTDLFLFSPPMYHPLHSGPAVRALR